MSSEVPATGGCFMPACWDNGKCDPTGIWGSYGRIVLMALIAAAAVAAIGTFFFVLSKMSTLPASYWALPPGLAVLSVGLYFIWKISVYRNAHVVGEKFQICGCPIACLSDPPAIYLTQLFD